MEILESSNWHSVELPPINFLRKSKLEEAELQAKQSAGLMVDSHSYSFASAPTLPHKHRPLVPNTLASVPSGGLISPPESSVTLMGDNEFKRQSKQLLPSIHEALRSNHLSYKSEPACSSDTGHGYFPCSSALSPTDVCRRSLTTELQSQNSSILHPQTPSSPNMNPPSSSSHSQQSQPDPSSRASLPSSCDSLYPSRKAHSRIGYMDTNMPHSQTQQHSSVSDICSNPANPSHAYSQYPQRYPHVISTSTPSHPIPSSRPLSESATFQPTWRSDGNEVSRVEGRIRDGRSRGPAAFGESVKRHLESFDLEASLNEIAEASGQMLEFTRHFGQRANKTAQSEGLTGSLPSVLELETIMKQETRLQWSLARIREVVVTQQTDLADQGHDSRSNNNYNHRPVNVYDREDSASFQEEGNGGGGVSSADTTKKRRGRAAPPGRCHSCNRAETPEWRRGPDGARTLCNACGLHYAKLTRKLAGNRVSISNSHHQLRPPKVIRQV